LINDERNIVGLHAKNKKRTNKAVAYLAITAGALAMSVGGVLAANSITINSGNSIEFGQGVSATASCDSGLTAALNQSYDTATSKFLASTVVVSGIKDYDCAGKNIHVSLIGASGTVCSIDGTHSTAGTGQDQFLIADGGTSGSNDDISKTVTIGSGCDASTIVKVAITTS
jgi:hypothetical protein